MNINTKFVLHLKELRKKYKFTQERLAELSNLDRSYLSEVEGGKKNISLEKLEQIAHAFDLTLSQLLDF